MAKKDVVYSDMNLALHNGIAMPAVGLGTFRLTNHDLLFKTINYALESGYRLFDTAAVRKSEMQLHKIFKQLLPHYGLVREDIFIMTKLSPFSSGGRFLSSKFEKAMGELDLDYIDLYLIHFPASPFIDPDNKKNIRSRKESWLALTKLYNESKVRAIGVSNFTLKHLMELAEVMALGPMVNQVEWHPYYYRPEMLKYCCEHNIRILAYNSFGGLSRGNRELINDPVVWDVANKHNASSTQVLLLWALQRGVAVIPPASKDRYIKSNKDLHFKLTEKDMLKLDKLGVKNKRYAWDPNWIA